MVDSTYQWYLSTEFAFQKNWYSETPKTHTVCKHDISSSRNYKGYDDRQLERINIYINDAIGGRYVAQSFFEGFGTKYNR